MKKILFIERKLSDLISIERVFRQIARNLSETEFEHSFQKVAHQSNLWGMIRNLLFFRKEPADVYHVTGHIYYMALALPKNKTAVTYHDVRFLHTNNGLKRFVMKKLLVDWPVNKLDYITAISEKTKAELIFFTGCDEKKIRVIENPLYHNISPAEPNAFNAARPLVLQVGTFEYKNLPNLIIALHGVNCRLRIIGKLDETQLSLLQKHKIDYDNKWELNDAEIKAEYEEADIVTLCSTAEGFGLPIIEAQAMRKPVVTSNISPMKEVAGGAAHLVDPYDPLQIRDAVLKIIGDREYREGLVAKGTENIKRFDPATIAGAYEKLYQEIIDRNKN